VEKTNIQVNPDVCTICSSCQLRCSLVYTGAFNPLKARIVVEPGSISFTDDCVANCHLCADYCVYGALTRAE
jgi:NAD-dependent dihydropyrimidine dehydrogenase PreA subunit